jgi:predicted transcriptional regulator
MNRPGNPNQAGPAKATWRYAPRCVKQPGWHRARPVYAEAILLGLKTVELRRTRPRVAIPTDALIYASSPTRALVGTCRVESLEELPIALLWKRTGTLASITYADFHAYFDGVASGFALHLSSVHRLASPIGLTRLRENIDGFNPPQSFRYLPVNDSNQLLRA